MRLILVGSILLSTVMPSSAVSLGRHGGAAVIGRPLDVRVEALTGPDEVLSESCIRAEVQFGEARLASSAVRITPQRSAPDASASIRIQTTVPVNEPVVTFEVKAGCASPFVRRYVLLADPAPNPANAASGPSPAAELAITRTLESSAGEVAASTGSSAASASGPAREAAPVSGAASRADEEKAAAPQRSRGTATKPATSAPARRSVVRKPEPEVQAPTPRLQLDPVDLSLSIERDPVLRLSLSLLSEPTSSEEERAAAGRLWRAINATPEEILRDSQKLAVLEAESKGLREKEAQDEAAIKAMQAELEQTRYITWLAYLLGALLLVSLAGLWFFWRRKEGQTEPKRDAAWWGGADKKVLVAAAPSAGAKASARRDPVAVDIDLDMGPESAFDDYESLHGHDSSMRAVLPVEDSRTEEGNSVPGSRSVATEELFDVQQQADFFVSLGEADKAIGVLKNHLVESQEPSALAYLDLFRLYHQQNRREDYEELREAFNEQFNAGAPPFDEYSDNSVGLEGYERAFGRIQALWPQPKVLDVIEKSIFRDVNDKDGEVFDLEAYRELLLLHAVAKEMIKRDHKERSAEGAEFEHTAIKPLKAAAGASAAASSAEKGPNTEPFEIMPLSSPRLGLDVDLDALAEASAFEASLPEVEGVVEATSTGAKGRSGSSVADEGNLIDFEVMDFMLPDADDPLSKKKG
ncbi:MAG: hypothetical protein R3E56_13740 [Burkholderiaceae bacterium]